MKKKEIIAVLAFATGFFVLRLITTLSNISCYYFGKHDTALWLQQFWYIANGKIPFETFAFLNEITHSHFVPAAYCFYYVTYSHYSLLLLVLIEIFFFAVSFIPLYMLGRLVTGEKTISFILSAAPFFAFMGNTQHFYFMSLLLPFLCFALLFIQQKRYALATVFFLCAISFREYMALAWLVLGILFVIKERRNKYGYIWIGASCLWLLFYICFIYTCVTYHFSYLGASKKDIITTFLSKPLVWISAFANIHLLRNFLSLFLPLGLLSLIGLRMLLPIFPILFLHILSKTPVRACSHYTIFLVPFITYSAFVGYKRVNDYLKNKHERLSRYFSAALCVFVLVYNAPMIRLFAYNVKKSILFNHALKMHTDDVKNISALIPATASLALNNNLTPYFAKREKVYDLEDCVKIKAADILSTIEPEYVLWDFLYADSQIEQTIMRDGWSVLKNTPSRYYESNTLMKKYDGKLLTSRFPLEKYKLLKQQGSLVLYVLKNQQGD